MVQMNEMKLMKELLSKQLSVFSNLYIKVDSN